MIPNYMNTRPVSRPPFGLQGLTFDRNGSSATLTTSVRSVRFAPKTSSRNRFRRLRDLACISGRGVTSIQNYEKQKLQ